MYNKIQKVLSAAKVCLASLLFLTGSTSNAGEPEYSVKNGVDPSGMPFTFEGNFKDGFLVDGTITVGTTEKDAYVFSGSTFPKGIMVGTLQYRDGRRFKGSFRAQGITTFFYGNGSETRLDGCTYTGFFDNNALTGKGSVACPGKTITGTFEYSRPKGPATIDFSDGRQLKASFRDGLESGKGELTYPSGVLEAQVYVEGKTVLSIPRLPKSISATCAGIPENWALLQGKCGAAGIEGNAELVRTYDGDPASARSYRAERISGIFKKGKAISEMRYETIPFSGSEPSIQILGNMNERLEFTKGSLLLLHHYIRGARATEWSVSYKGDFAGFKPNGKGQCSLSDVGSFEQCEMQAGQRIDLAYKDRTAAEARRAEEIHAEAWRQNAEADRQAAQAERDAEAAWRSTPSRVTIIGTPFQRSDPNKSMRELKEVAASSTRIVADIERVKAEGAAEKKRNELSTTRTQDGGNASPTQQQQTKPARNQTSLSQQPLSTDKTTNDGFERKPVAKSPQESAKSTLPTVTVKEAVAVCERNDNDYWICDGPVQKTLVGDKGTVGLTSQLTLAGCPSPRNERSSPDGKGKLFLCGFGLNSYDRDVARLRGFSTPRYSYKCTTQNCNALADSREIDQ